jgi:hypothetical protein
VLYRWDLEEILVSSFEDDSVSRCRLTLKQVVPSLSYPVLAILFILLVRASDVLPPTVWMWPVCYDESVSCNVNICKLYNILTLQLYWHL